MAQLTVERFRTRWRRWLGNKTAVGKPYWTTLLNSRWSRWCYLVCRDHGIEYKMDWTRESVKRIYAACIDVATMDELMALDNIYASEQAGYEATRGQRHGR